MKDHLPDAVIAAAAAKGSFLASVTAFFAGVTANTIAAIGGLIVAVLGLVVSWHYKRREDRRREEAHRLVVQRALLSPYEDDAG
ncbi:holin [Pseudoxanthomonas koreensis]|uniref:holin n=1 Tax=Pseudoxanthomonas koreensis TaxID=266061 RepID=UPI001390F5CF|nr:holin [Pseudoxanthomonas koreensis]